MANPEGVCERPQDSLTCYLLLAIAIGISVAARVACIGLAGFPRLGGFPLGLLLLLLLLLPALLLLLGLGLALLFLLRALLLLLQMLLLQVLLLLLSLRGLLLAGVFLLPLGLLAQSALAYGLFT